MPNPDPLWFEGGRAIALPTRRGLAQVEIPNGVDWHKRAADGVNFPERFAYIERAPQQDKTPDYVVLCTMSDLGHPRVDEVRVKAVAGGLEVRPADVRRLKSIHEVIEICAEYVFIRMHGVVGDSFKDTESQLRELAARDRLDAKRLVRTLRERAPRLNPDTTVEGVARVYLEAVPTGKPTKAVVEELGMQRKTAEVWIRKARDRGLIPPTTKGRIEHNHG